jgi:adenylate cyclase
VNEEQLETILLGGTRRYTRLEVAEKAGVPPERASRLWRALGFATVGDDEVVFTDADIDAMRTAVQLISSGLLDERLEAPVTRALGQHLSRLAEWQADMLHSLIDGNEELRHDDRQIAVLVNNLLPELEKVQTFVWRRHLAAFAGRVLTTRENPPARTVLPGVAGFVDMVGYTGLTRKLDEGKLSEVLESFEGIAADAIADQHGRVVKMIGDEVLFVADSPGAAAEIALTIVERIRTEGTLPKVRAGMAAGRILSRFGDVYGSVVNLASRLTSTARPGTVLVDRELADALAEDPAYEVRPGRAVSVRGYRRLRPYVLRRISRNAGR